MDYQNDLFVPDCTFETNNDLEIPTLRLDMQPQFCEKPFVLFGEQKRTYNMQGCGVLHFYSDDYRWQSVYEHPEKILKHNPSCIVEPNFSLFNDTPVAFGMQAVYKKRAVARMMQEKGIRVFVDLNVAPKFYALNLYGVPNGYRCFCTRGYEDRPAQLDFEYEIAKGVAGTNPMFVVYGGGEKIRQQCRENGYIYVTPMIAIKNKLKCFEKMREAVAFFDKPIEIQKELPTLEQMKENQVDDFRKEQKLLK